MSELIFVTGASGFLGPHVVLQLLEKGYHVRAVARGTKADFLKSSYSSYGDHFEVVRIADIAHDQFPEALVGVDAVVHLASPLAGRAEPVALLASAVEGTPNVLVQAEKAGVKRMVVTSSIATVQNPNDSFMDQDWIPVTREIALTSTNEMITYAASKKFSEIALWEWADRRPHVEPRVLNPPFFYGPFTSHFPIPSPNFNTLSTNAIFYNYLFPDGAFGSSTPYIGIRDVAQVGRKRIIIGSPHGWPFQKTVDFIAPERPTLKSRLITATSKPGPYDVLGMKIVDFHTTEETTLDTIDALVKVEDQWQNAGHAIKTPPSF